MHLKEEETEHFQNMSNMYTTIIIFRPLPKKYIKTFIFVC